MMLFTSFFRRFSRCVLIGVALSLPVSAQNNFYMEVESVPPVAPWVKKTEKTGFYGDCYYFWDAGDAMGNPTGVMTYSFTLSEAGKYLFDIRGRRDKEGRCISGKHDVCNDIFVNIAGKGWAKKMVKIPNEVKGIPNLPEDQVYKVFGKWLWDYGWEKGPDLTFSPGTYSLLVAGRSADVMIDAMRLYKVGATPPEPPGVGVSKSDRSKNSGKILYANTTIENGEVFSYNGKLIKTFSKVPYSSVTKGLKTGMYVLKISAAGTSHSHRLMISDHSN